NMVRIPIRLRFPWTITKAAATVQSLGTERLQEFKPREDVVTLPKIAAAMAALTFALFAAAPGWAQSGEKITVKVGVTGRPDQAGLEIAFRRGYFAEQNLDVQFVGGGSSAQDFVAALATNQLQVTAGSPSAGMVNALNRGIDLRIVADWAHIDAGDNTFALVARSDLMDSGALTTPQQLKGRTIAVGPSLGAYKQM